MPGRALDDLLLSLLTSDLALEIRAEFMEHVRFGATPADATSQVLSRFGRLLASPDDGPVIILSLAALQLREGQLSATFRDAAIDLIDSGEALAAYRLSEATARQARDDLLAEFADALAAATTGD